MEKCVEEDAFTLSPLYLCPRFLTRKIRPFIDVTKRCFFCRGRISRFFRRPICARRLSHLSSELVPWTPHLAFLSIWFARTRPVVPLFLLGFKIHSLFSSIVAIFWYRIRLTERQNLLPLRVPTPLYSSPVFIFGDRLSCESTIKRKEKCVFEDPFF